MLYENMITLDIVVRQMKYYYILIQVKIIFLFYPNVEAIGISVENLGGLTRRRALQDRQSLFCKRQIKTFAACRKQGRLMDAWVKSQLDASTRSL